MNKIFNIVISAFICMALLLVPMTVDAVDAQEGIDYNINYETYLIEGTNNYTIDSTVPYTVYILYPTAVGDYTITSDAKIGIVSYIDLWVQLEPSAEVTLNEVKWSCNDENQAIMIGVESDLDEVSITVSWSDPTVVEIPWTVYENKITPEKFEMPDFIDVDAFDDDYVDVADDVVDDAVLGDDGYYHLNDKNGPVLFVNLNESVMSLYTMVGYGKIAAIYYDDNGDVTKKVDYTNAFNEYVAALPTDDSGNITSYYYPLTADLIEIFKEVGDTHGWYDGENPWVYASEDAWLYACYFNEDVITMDSDANSGNDTENDNNNNNNNNNNTNNGSNGTTGGATTNNTTTNTNTNTNTNTDSTTKSPTTGDSTAALAVAMLSAAALVIGVKVKK